PHSRLYSLPLHDALPIWTDLLPREHARARHETDDALARSTYSCDRSGRAPWHREYRRRREKPSRRDRTRGERASRHISRARLTEDRKSTRLNSSHQIISY